ncbi:MAG TPA: nucleotidyl transferase AbiEii/AbiGii toxin family protein [bacterium]|nr:nucleotidyl transferase AbiEii/AbiGii toxin family protein [bacterium]
MRISGERLFSEAEATGFRPEVLEKVIHLLNLLEMFRSHPFLNGRLALKGGTALNVFVFDLPRLSVDIDLNYIGAVERDAMLSERPKIEEAIPAVCKREGFSVRRVPHEHAGGKWSLRYESALGQGGNLGIDINFMFRVPLWPVKAVDSRVVGSYKATKIPMLDIHELAAGKLTALLARRTSRDLFDVHILLTKGELERERLRLAFVVYGAMSRKDWRTVAVEDVRFDQSDVVNQLIPLLRADAMRKTSRDEAWGRRLVDDCREALSVVLPFTEAEMEFLDRLLEHGEIKPSLITSDGALAERIAQHPLLEWKALNVQRHKAGSVKVEG